ncbi:MAG: hypothetical protein ACPGRZ_13100 [Alphaproteobacteria bacterium]
MTTDAGSAVRLQELFVRLLFCDDTFEAYRTDPQRLLSIYDLDGSALAALPKPDTPQLQAERQGRRTGVEQEIRKVFGQSYGLLEKHPGYDFGDFLCSDAFYDPGAGLPHPFGSGPGYENASKFYFWVVAALDFASAPDGAQTRWMVNGDFAAHLIEQHNLGADDYYRRFAEGVFWRERADTALPVIHMNGDRQVFRIADAAALDSLLDAGTVCLDDLSPVPAPGLENIR